ncbi:MAG: ABC-2 family transporter protein [Chloroflexi bacterium]|nr:ABC-2 family transporter protein [Chloroflexota bacterium]
MFTGIGRDYQQLMAFGASLEPPNLTWWLVPWLAVVIGSGIIIQLSLTMIVASSAFYNVRLGAATNSLERTAWQMNLFPASAYSAVVQVLITIALPWAFMAFYPAHLLYGRGSEGLFGAPVLYLSPVAALIAFAVGYGIWRRGIRSYQGMGGM